MKTLGLDESGDDNLIRIDPGYSVFVLGGVIFDDEYAQARAGNAITAFKRDLFGRTDFVLHTAEIIRNAGVFAPLANRNFRNEFYDRLNAMLRDLDFSVVACAIRKDRLDLSTNSALRDPYCYALGQLTVQFCRLIGSHGNGGRIQVERRQAAADRRVLRHWRNLQQFGAAEFSGRTIRHRIASLSFHDKSERVASLELADLVVTPIGRHVVGYPDRPDWHLVRAKLLNGADSAVTVIPEER